MIGALLPVGVATAEAFGDDPRIPVFPGEEATIAQAVEKRRREFVTTRRCARQALATLGHPPVPIGVGPNREPCWPRGIVGSLTHCDGYRAAAVAPDSIVASLGIDAERHSPTPPGVLDLIALPNERDHLQQLGRRDRARAANRLVGRQRDADPVATRAATHLSVATRQGGIRAGWSRCPTGGGTRAL